mgnify:CR=1 FL=1
MEVPSETTRKCDERYEGNLNKVAQASLSYFWYCMHAIFAINANNSFQFCENMHRLLYLLM